MSNYRDRLVKRERPQEELEIPAIGSWVRNLTGSEGQVVDHILREGRPPVIRVRFRQRCGSYLLHEIVDAGTPTDPQDIAS